MGSGQRGAPCHLPSPHLHSHPQLEADNLKDRGERTRDASGEKQNHKRKIRNSEEETERQKKETESRWGGVEER